MFSNGDLGQFYDVQGTTWTGAPLFADPNQTIRVGRRTYDLFYDGNHLETIAWREYGAVYWVHNTLTDAVGNGELLAIAEQTAPIGAIRSTPRHADPQSLLGPDPRGPDDRRRRFSESVGRVGGLVDARAAAARPARRCSSTADGSASQRAERAKPRSRGRRC